MDETDSMMMKSAKATSPMPGADVQFLADTLKREQHVELALCSSARARWVRRGVKRVRERLSQQRNGVEFQQVAISHFSSVACIQFYCDIEHCDILTEKVECKHSDMHS